MGCSNINMFLLCSESTLQLRISVPPISVPDEGYSRNASCALNLISTLLSTNCQKV